MRLLVAPLLALLLAASLPAAAQDLLSGESKSESSADVLQKLLLGKVKEKSATAATSGTKAAPTTAEHLPRKAAAKASGTAKAGAADKDAAPEGQPAKPARSKPRPTREADFHPLPRLKPTAPISASPTIQPPKPIPMPAGPTP